MSYLVFNLWIILSELNKIIAYAVTNTRGAIGFPVIIILLIPFRAYLVPRMKIFTEEEINILDGPAANDFVSS